jgi:hypothetical protein
MSAIGGIKVRGVRIVVHDRHERDRSSQACSANNKATFVRHSTGGEVERYEELTSITDAVFGMYKDRAARIAGHSHIPTGGRRTTPYICSASSSATRAARTIREERM